AFVLKVPRHLRMSKILVRCGVLIQELKEARVLPPSNLILVDPVVALDLHLFPAGKLISARGNFHHLLDLPFVGEDELPQSEVDDDREEECQTPYIDPK